MSDIKKPFGRATTATERMTAARVVKQVAIETSLLWALDATHRYPSWLMAPRVPQHVMPWLLVIELPTGRINYRVTRDEMDSGLFDHLEQRANDGVEAREKYSALFELAMRRVK